MYGKSSKKSVERMAKDTSEKHLRQTNSNFLPVSRADRYCLVGGLIYFYAFVDCFMKKLRWE